MDLTTQINALPKPPVGYVRAIRVEDRYVPTRGASSSYLPVEWWCLPTPQEESSWSFDFNDGQVCATLPEQFPTWFPEHIIEQDNLGQAHVVALDVPQEAVVQFPQQLVIMRHLAKQVAVLLQ